MKRRRRKRSHYLYVLFLLCHIHRETAAETCIETRFSGDFPHGIACDSGEHCCSHDSREYVEGRICCESSVNLLKDLWYFWIVLSLLIALLLFVILWWWKKRQADNIISIAPVTKGTNKHLRPLPPPQLVLDRRQQTQTPYPDAYLPEEQEAENAEHQGAVGLLQPLNPAYLPVSTKPITASSDLPGYLGPDLRIRYG